MGTQNDPELARSIADARRKLDEKSRTCSTYFSTPELDALELRLALLDDGVVGCFAEAALSMDARSDLTAVLEDAFWCTDGGLDESTKSQAMRDVDAAGRVHLRSLESLVSSGCVTSTMSVHLLAELHVLRKDQETFHSESLMLQREQVELLRQMVGESSEGAA